MDLFKLVGRIVLDGVESAQSGLEKVSKKAQAVGNKIEAAGKKITNVGKKFAPVSAAAAGALGVAVKSASNFEDAMAKVSTIADTSTVSIGELQQQIMNLSTESGIAAADIAENVYNAISAGQKTGDAVSFVENATKLARAGFTDSASALDILSTAMNAYGLEANEVGNVSDKLIMTQNLGKTTVAELASAMGRAIPTAKAVGVNIDQLCGSYAVMTSNGISTAETTTYLNSMLNELGKQGTTAANAFLKGTEQIKEGGLSISEAMEMGWSLTDVLGVLSEQAEASGTSINNMFSSAEAGKAASVLSDQAEKLDSAIQQMGNSAGATEEAYKKMETTSFNVQKSLNQLKNTAITLGQTVLQMAQPLIEKLAAGVEKLSTWFNSLNSSQQETVAKIMGIVAVAAPLLMVIGSIVSGIGGLITAFGSAGLAIAAINPVVLAVVAGIAALIAIGVLLYKNWDTIKTKAVEIWQNIVTTVTNKANEIKENAIAAFENLKAKVQEIAENVKSKITEMVENLKTKFEEFKTAVSEKFQEIVTTAEEKIASFLSIGENIVNNIRDGIAAGWDSLVSWFNGLISGLASAASGFLGGITGGISSGGGGSAGRGRFSHASGLDYVPYNNYPANLHEGEAVLTASEADAWRKGKTGSEAGQTVVPIILDVTQQIDGMTLAKNQYKYNLIVSRNHGVSLVQGV